MMFNGSNISQDLNKNFSISMKEDVKKVKFIPVDKLQRKPQSAPAKKTKLQPTEAFLEP